MIEHQPTITFRIYTAILRAKRALNCDLTMSVEEMVIHLYQYVPDIVDCDPILVYETTKSIVEGEIERDLRSKKFAENTKHSA